MIFPDVNWSVVVVLPDVKQWTMQSSIVGQTLRNAAPGEPTQNVRSDVNVNTVD